MEPLGLIVALVALAAVVGFVAAPLVRPRRRADEAPTGPGLLEAERRNRALAALRELEFDHRTGKIAEDDYAALLGPLRAEAAEALEAVAAEAAG